MKIKFSNKKSLLLLLVLSLVVIILVVLSGNGFDVSERSNKKRALNLPYINQKTPLSLIEIVVSEKNYQKLEKYKNRALSVGVISAKDKKYVSATIIYEGEKYKADIRLKGDWVDHLKGDKWSFRIKLKGDKTILGMRKFSIHHPKTRGYINEWLFHKANKAEGLIGLRYGFVEGVLHINKTDNSGFINKNLGIYAIEETFDKRMLENNGRKESIIIKFSEAYWWRDVKKRYEVGKESGIRWDQFKSSESGPWKFPVTVFSESKVLENPQLSSYFKLSKSFIYNLRHNNTKISEVFNAKQLAMHNALSNLFGAQHGNVIINLRFFYNPITSKLEPISFDGNSGQLLTKYNHFIFAKKERDTLYFKELIKALEIVSKKEYLTNLLRENNKELNDFNVILKKEFQFSELKLKNYYSNQEVIKEALKKLKSQYLIQNTKENNNGSPILINNYKKWEFKNSSIVPRGNSIFSLKRVDSSKSSYTKVANYSTDFQKIKRVSFKVKKTTKGDLFAIRIQGEYPNRVDAVFDLTAGKVVGIDKIGPFKDELATIKKLNNGWYLCTLVTKPTAKLIKVIIGTTNRTNDVLSWEYKTNKNKELLIYLQQD